MKSLVEYTTDKVLEDSIRLSQQVTGCEVTTEMVIESIKIAMPIIQARRFISPVKIVWQKLLLKGLDRRLIELTRIQMEEERS